jgi:uncharacterized protein YxjI
MKSELYTPDFFVLEQKSNRLDRIYTAAIFDQKGNCVVSAKRKELNSRQKFISFFLPSVFSYSVELKNSEGKTESTIIQEKVLNSTLTIKNNEGATLGKLISRLKFLKLHYEAVNDAEEIIFEIHGDRNSLEFKIIDNSQKQIGLIKKDWKGTAKEILNASKTFKIQINSHFCKPEYKMLILSSAVAINIALINMENSRSERD